MRRAFKLALSMLLASPLASHASSNPLEFCQAAIDYDQYETTSNHIGAAVCVGYIRGIYEGYIASSILQKEPQRVFCEPNGVTFIQMVRIVERWKQNNPALIHQEPSLTVYTALNEAFPCK